MLTPLVVTSASAAERWDWSVANSDDSVPSMRAAAADWTETLWSATRVTWIRATVCWTRAWTVASSASVRWSCAVVSAATHTAATMQDDRRSRRP